MTYVSLVKYSYSKLAAFEVLVVLMRQPNKSVVNRGSSVLETNLQRFLTISV